MKGRKALYYLLWPLDILFWPFGRRDRKAKRQGEEEGTGARQPHRWVEEWAEIIFVLVVPPLFLFYLMGWRPFTGRKEDEP